MVAVVFGASAVAGLLLALVFLAVGAALHQRSRMPGQAPLATFCVFWIGVGAYGLAEAGWALLFLAGLAPLPVALFVLQMKIVAIVTAFAGLVGYLLLIHGIDRRVLAGIFGSYGVVLATVATFYAWRDPVGQEAGVWGMRLVYEVKAVEPWWTLMLLVLFLPPILASVAYAGLLRQAGDRLTRWRIRLTATSLFLFFAPLFLGWRLGSVPLWGLLEKALATMMAAGILIAHWPPKRLRAWVIARPTLRARDDALRHRAEELV